MGKILAKTVFLIFGTILCLVETGQTQTLLFTGLQLAVLDTAVLEKKVAIQPYLTELREYADLYMKKGPWSVTFNTGKSISGDPHDYYSEAPYWWPDPDDPDAPYIRKDGLRYPGRFTEHKESLAEMTIAVSVLSLAGHYLEEPSYSLRAAEFLRIWFIDEQTKMNPNLNYAQAIPNKSPGRCFGIIDTHNWTKWFDALELLSKSGQWLKNDQDKLRRWFADYLEWMLESENGREEKMRRNNHATWWTAQTAAVAGYTGRSDLIPMLENHARHFLVGTQIDADGRCPEEEARTRSYDYALFNLEAFGFLSRIFERYDIDLWEWTNKRGGSVKKALDYMIPYMQEPEKWTGQQITNMNIREPAILVFAGMRYPEYGYLTLYQTFMTRRKPGSADFRYDPFRLWLNLLMTTKRYRV